MKKRSSVSPFIWIGVLLVFSLILSACAAATASPTPAAATAAPATAVPATAVPATQAPTAEMPAEAAINVVQDPTLGPILVDGNGMTLYMFTKDTPDTVNCSGKCIENWPPLVTQGSPTLGDGVDAAMIGTADLSDGSKIVTYNHMPLYDFSKDKTPGDVVGQGNNDVWYVVAPDGKPVGIEPTINVSQDPTLGPILVGENGMTLYMFTKDTADTVNCSGKCIENWPPLVTKGSPTLGDRVDAAMIGTADLPDGTKIVTYNHMPLYYFIKDKAPGDVVGQGNNDVWYVVAPDGKPVGMEPTINVSQDPTLGPILVGENGMTLYMFAKDTADTVNCSGKCIENWPPLLTAAGKPILGEGVDGAMIGTADLPDGTKIVTYNHMPLYYYIKDTKAGDVVGQGNNDVWYVVAPDGTAVGR